MTETHFQRWTVCENAIAPRVPPTPSSFTPTAAWFVSAHGCQSLGVVGFELHRDSKSHHTVSIRWHAASCPHSGSITAQLEPKNKKPGISWIKLAVKSCMRNGSWAYFVFENKIQLKPVKMWTTFPAHNITHVVCSTLLCDIYKCKY